MEFTHLDKEGNAIMVDVSDKEITHRTATACGKIIVGQEIIESIKENTNKKGDVLAISNSESLNYNTTSNDFIMISSSDEMKGKGIKISLKGENHICILVSPEFKRAYATLNDPKISAVLGSHLVFEAFVHTLVEIAQEKEDHSGKEWYRLFVQALAVTGDSVDEFKLKAMDDRNVDMSYIYKVAQEMISNSLETTAIKIRGQEEKK